MGNPFAGHALLNPDLSVEQVTAALADLWGLTAAVELLESNQDQNFRARTTDGCSLVVKVASSGIDRSALEVQCDVLTHLGGNVGDIEVPTVIESIANRRIESVAGFDVFVVTWIAGVPMNSAGEMSDGALQRFGRLAGSAVAALADADVPAATRVTQWDPARAGELVEALAGQTADLLPAGLAAEVVARAEAGLRAVRDRLPRQVIHGDLTDFNVVGRRDEAGRLVPAGIIDFGDTVTTWRIAELAVTATALVARSPGDPLRAVIETARGFGEVVDLTDDEVDAVWPAVLARAALLAVGDAQQAVIAPDNPYPRHALAIDRPILEAVAGVPDRFARAAVRLAFGRAPDPDAKRVAAILAERSATGQIGPVFPPELIARYEPVDLTASSSELGAGEWEDLDAFTRLVHRPGTAVVGRHGEARITFARGDTAEETRTVHQGQDIFVPAGTPVISPFDAAVDAVAERTVWLRPTDPALGEVIVRLLNVGPVLASAGTVLSLGAPVGSVAAQPRATNTPAHLHVQVGIGIDRPAGATTPRHAAAWRALSPSLWPEPTWSADPVAPPTTAVDQRRRHVARPQKIYYASRPIEIVRGWRHHLYDRHGRAYLDMVNNVAVVGHSHPRITEAASRQLAALNTNSRFLYPSITRLADRLAGLVPEPLGSVFFVNSGSEAVDLAIRLARHATGHRGVIAIEGGYHGWTGSVTEFTSNRFDNPSFYDDQPDHIAVVGSPDLYRGLHRDADDPAAAYAAEMHRAVRRLDPHGGVAAFVFEGLLGNQGGLDLPTGYLAAACAHVRAAGGVCIADEVQVGYGRTGTSWWAFEQHGVVPDIVTVAKAMGNGHPVGAVITTPAIAESFAASFPFFSSVGGGPVSCEIALAVLDVIDDEGLQANAAVVGERLRAGLMGLGGTHELVGAVHGRGLYLGVDLVLDRLTKAPAVAVADAICDRLRDRGVIVQTTGDLGNILKVKPPMCLTESSADFFVEQLDRVLSDGW